MAAPRRRRGSSLFPELGSVERSIASIDRLLNHLMQRIDQMAIDVAKITASVARIKTVDDSLLALVTQLGSGIKDLSAQLKAAIDANDPAAQAAVQASLDALASDLDTKSDEIQRAVVENTPAAPSA